MSDTEGAIRLVEDLQEYEETVHVYTWEAVLAYACELRGYKDGQTKGDPQRAPIKISFFSATPQGGGVALIRHAIIRFSSQLGVYMSCYIPVPDGEAFRITEHHHNILQGVSNPEARFGVERKGIRDG
ncbi:hypothetical protein HOY80DRAFT_1056965 [Tuber brumale]|nr:hypothetical protein HOY80DRAFT_1056965 [Tuber brumale]